MLSENLRDQLKEYLAQARRDGMFGDGQEMEYIYEGCTIVGLNEMSDKQLIEEYEEYVDSDDAFLCRLQLEMEMDEALQ